MKPTPGYWKERRVAVTGATGFVGYHLTRALVEAGARVTAVVRSSSNRSHLNTLGISFAEASLVDPQTLECAFQGSNLVFHAAGLVDFSGAWEAVRQTNIDGTANVVRAAQRAGVRRLIFTSSIVAVGASSQPELLTETAPWSLGTLKVPYVTSKRRAEEIALAAAGNDLEVVAAVPSCVIGPNDYTRSEFGTLCRRFWRGRVPFIFGGGSNFVDVRDVAVGHLLAAEKGRSGERYLLTGTNRSFTSFFADLTRIAGRAIPRFRVPTSLARIGADIYEGVLRRKPSRSGLTATQARLLGLYFYFDASKAERELGFTPRPLAVTLRDTYSDWRENEATHLTKCRSREYEAACGATVDEPPCLRDGGDRVPGQPYRARSA